MGLCPEGFCPRGFCPRELYDFWFLGDFVQWDYVLRDFLS